jgi:hypothetical protein
MHGAVSERIHGILESACEQSGMPKDVGMGQHAFFDEKVVMQPPSSLVCFVRPARPVRMRRRHRVKLVSVREIALARITTSSLKTRKHR